MISLTDGTTLVYLPPDLYWEDESWLPVGQSAQRTITGGLVVQIAAMVTGRPITLRPEDDNSAWMLEPVLTQLRVWAAIPGQELTLNLRGTAYTVLWRHQDGAIEATPVLHYSDVDAADYYRATLRLMEIS